MLFCDALGKVNKIMLNVTLTPASITHLLISAYTVLDTSTIFIKLDLLKPFYAS